MSTALTLAQMFTRELEALGGKVHEASSTSDIVKIIAEIAVRSGSKRIITSRLTVDNEEQLLTELRKEGFELVQLDNLTQPRAELASVDLAVTCADMIIASTGTIVITTYQDEHRLATCLPRVHIAIAHLTEIVSDPQDANNHVRKQLAKDPHCAVSFISGPSRTADIEMKLILGVHGPHELHVILKR